MKSIGEIAREQVRTPRRRPMTGRRWRDGVFYAVFVAAILVGIAGLLTLLLDTLIDALPWLDWNFISTYASRKPEQAGILAPLAGTAWIMIMTALFTVPVGVATAVFLEEFAGRSWYTRLIQLNISNLAGVPSIIYGLLGLSVFVYSLSMGRSIVAGALTLTLLVLPIVIIASQEAIKAVPSGYRDAALAIGATRWQVVKSVVLPEAIPSIMSGVILALSRAIGESAPILMISAIVFLTFVPTGPDDRFTVLPLQIYTWVAQPQVGFRGIAAAAIIVLLVMLLAMNALAIAIRLRYQRQSEE